MPDTTNTAVETNKNPGRNWTDEEKDLVWEEVIKGKDKGLPLTECFRRIARLLPHRSEAAIGMLYYNVLRKERDESEIPTKPAKPPKREIKRELTIDADLVEAFQGLPEYIAKLHKRLDQLEQKINQPDPEAVISALVNALQNYQAQDQLNTLQAENSKLKEQLAKLQQAYEDALGIYDMFTNMASISQIMSLGDFKQQMKTTLDRWGNVLKITFERADAN
jgi:predicted nuclease with TOPRIM domain